jgi:glycine betaine/proline transport system substrate-binding protein
MKKITSIFLLFTILLMTVSCERRRKEDVIMLYPNWADGIAITYLAKVILEEKGYTVTMKRLEPGPIYTSLSRGDTDIYMDAWLPYTHKDYWDKYGSKLDIIGTAFDDGVTGLVVPTYVDINSIEELNANKERFDGKIYGIASGAGINTNTQKAIEAYNLELKQISSSETSMITALKKAVAHNEWIVITGWKPHFIWANYDLKVLDDPKGVYPADRIEIVSRKGFSADHPELAAFYKNFSLDEKMLNELMTDVSEDRDPTVGARKFYEKHKSTLDTWVVPKVNKK